MTTLASPSPVGFDAERLARVSQWLRAQVDGRRLAGAGALVGRGSGPAWFDAAGLADVDAGRAFARDTVVRIYSMTKPVTTVAAMILYERGSFQLDDPVSVFLPAFGDVAVLNHGARSIDDTVPLETPMTVRHLMTHTSGLTYGFMRINPVDAAYREQRIDYADTNASLAAVVERLATIPLVCQPGAQWNYSVSTDVLGRLVEVWSGTDLRSFLREEVLLPLAMHDTDFHVREANHARFAALYGPPGSAGMASLGPAASGDEPRDTRGRGLALLDGSGRNYLAPGTLHSGGGGLVGTIDDYASFCRMLLGRGSVGSTRLLGRKTVEYMLGNQLPGNADLAAMGQPVWSETSYAGIGFGLGGAVVIDPVKAHIITSPGEYHWGGAASTFFWVDPAEDLYAVFFTQLMPSSTYPLRRELRTLVYQALT